MSEASALSSTRGARGVLALAGLVVLYFLAGKLGLAFASVNASASAIWPPSGIAVAGLLVLGRRAWPAIFAGAFAVNLTASGAVAASLGIATGNTLEAVIGAGLVARLAGGRRVFERGQDALKLALIAFLCCTVSATVGAGTLAVTGAARPADLAVIWVTWWLGDVAGVLIVAPLLILWSEPRRAWAPGEGREWGALLLAVLVTSGAVFMWPPLSRHPLVFLCVPPLVWTAFRFGPREAATAIAAVACIATGATLRGAGPLVARTENESLLVVQAFLVTLAIMTQPVAALVAERRRASDERRRSEERFRLAVEAAPNAVLMVDARGAIALANAQSEALLGVRREALLGRAVESLVPGLLRGAEDAVRSADPAGPGGRPMRASRELSARRSAGREVPVEVALNPFTASDETFLLAALVDITERKRAEVALSRERELLQTVMDCIPVMITLYEPGTRVFRLNREFERTLGWTTEEALHLDLMTACYPDPAYREEVRGFMEALAPGWRDLEMTTRDGRVIETSWANVQLWNDVRVGIGLDVRERRQAERERDALMGRERAARAEAEASNRAKDEFLAMLGHELRNPLGAIASAVHVLGLLGADGDAGERPRDVIERQVAHLSRLVDDLLDVARVSSGQVLLAQETCDLGALVRQVVGTFRAAHRLDGHEVTAVAPRAWVEADPVRLEQVIANLLDNALKYTPTGGAIRVSVHAEPDAAVLTMSDTGAGIPAHLLARIFDLFVQGERGTDRGQGGLGVGLTLVRRLVELHQGTVEAASDGPGRGATFTVRLPRAVPPAEVPAAGAPVAAHRLRILLVEDNADAREMLSAVLRLQGHEVHVAIDGPEGVSAALALQPDAALVDIGLPGFDGYEVARRIRAGRAGRATRLVALTGYGQPEDRRRTRDAGFDDHLVKPVDPGRVAEVLKP